MKKVIAIALSMLLMLSVFCACGADSDEGSKEIKKQTKEEIIVGTWTANINDKMITTYVFKEDGNFTCQTAVEGVNLPIKEGKYEFDDEKVLLHYTGGPEAGLDYTFKGEKLEIQMSGNVLTKEK